MKIRLKYIVFSIIMVCAGIGSNVYASAASVDVAFSVLLAEFAAKVKEHKVLLDSSILQASSSIEEKKPFVKVYAKLASRVVVLAAVGLYSYVDLAVSVKSLPLDAVMVFDLDEEVMRYARAICAILQQCREKIEPVDAPQGSLDFGNYRDKDGASQSYCMFRQVHVGDAFCRMVSELDRQVSA